MPGTGTYEICKVPVLKFVFLANFSSSSPLFSCLSFASWKCNDLTTGATVSFSVVGA